MTSPAPAWRPRPRIRAIAIGLFRRPGQLLAAPVFDDAGAVKGWRPLGGGIEFAETAQECLRRELLEETGQEIDISQQIGVLENLFSHMGTQGHEIVFVLEAAFRDTSLYRQEQITFREGDGVDCTASWISLSEARSGQLTLFPDGLAALL